MTITHLIMLLGITVAAVVALIVGHLQRKQMRQIELYRQDPTVGLTPAPSNLARFVHSKWDTILGFGAPAVGLAIEFGSSAPLTRTSVLLISLSVAFLLVNVVMFIVFRLAERTASLLTELREAHERHLSLTQRLSDSVAAIAPGRTNDT